METNDNEPLSFSKIGLQAGLILNKLRLQARLSEPTEETEKESSPERSSADTEEQRSARNREYIERRLNELRAFERKASGK